MPKQFQLYRRRRKNRWTLRRAERGDFNGDDVNRHTGEGVDDEDRAGAVYALYGTNLPPFAFCDQFESDRAV